MPINLRRKIINLVFVALGLGWVGGVAIVDVHAAEKNPVIMDTENGRELVLTSDLKKFLNDEIPDHRIPRESEFNPDMLKYYFSNLIGIHPAVAWGDFNEDKKKDYALLLVTGDTPWGPLVELVICSEKKRGKFELYRLGEVYNFKDDYLRSYNGKLSKGRFRKSAWYINWNKKEKTFNLIKS